MVNAKHAFLLGGTHSGCGKTTLALALMAAFEARDLRVQPFKVGPDFIDTGLHGRVAARESRNLDGWMLSHSYNCELFQERMAGADLAVVEGVMGLYDGYDGLTEAGSSAQMAKRLGLPVILVVDASSMARSAAALVYGYSKFDPDLNLAGVVFNRVGGKGHLEYLKEAMASSLPRVTVFGGIPREEAVRIPERHLGLLTADEAQLTPQWRSKLVELVERHLDLDEILRKSVYSGPVTAGEKEKPPRSPRPVPIAVAKDAAFCFYYADNFDLLTRWGADLRFFSPLAGETLPPGSAGLILGGGYPELFASRLAGQGRFLAEVRRAAAAGMPVYAECGGLMTLSRSIETLEGEVFPMAGILPFRTRMLSRRKALGYTEVELRSSCLLGEPGQVIRGHEFHYSEIADMDEGESLERVYEIRGRKGSEPRPEGFATGSVLASYIHLHWGSSPGAPRHFTQRCRQFESSRRERRF
ncbi:MAG TPA: cobyrinate a,c-diamide synthase [Syntrophobacteraceae bacterium]|nr:cobyrinate a,c-diamide synthase [Syntrophobacteraceae bacterium]